MHAALCHHCDVMRSRYVIGHLTIRLSIDYSYTSSIEIKLVSLSLCLYDVINDTDSYVNSKIVARRVQTAS